LKEKEFYFRIPLYPGAGEWRPAGGGEGRRVPGRDVPSTRAFVLSTLELLGTAT
jgi:hypothetical protein